MFILHASVNGSDFQVRTKQFATDGPVVLILPIQCGGCEPNKALINCGSGTVLPRNEENCPPAFTGINQRFPKGSTPLDANSNDTISTIHSTARAVRSPCRLRDIGQLTPSCFLKYKQPKSSPTSAHYLLKPET